ncbi:MAG TPA: hypothetical protein VMY42_04635 [Thermoguttaceae bacterium]|nr:hypothetical protein [Thermoguttaceae bacterium]
MSIPKRFLPFVVVALCLPVVSVRAAEDGAQESPKSEAAGTPSAEQIARWIEELDADAFSGREQATAKLAAAGKAAIAALTESATSDSLEASGRSVRILRELFQSPDAPTKAAAEEALEKIARANHPASSPRAEEAIRPPAEAPALQPAGIAVVTTSVSMKNVNGVKEITVSENDRKISIKDDPQQGIQIEVTENKGGRQVTKTVQAKDAEDLKKQDKEAYDLYRQYSQGNAVGGAIQFRIQAGGIAPGGRIQIQPGMQPAFGQPIQILPGRAALTPAQRIEAATRQLELIGKQLQRTTEGAEKTDELRQALRQFEEELEKQLAEVEKHLEEKAEGP